MKATPHHIARLVAAGLSAEQMTVVLEVIDDLDETRRAAKREANAERQRRHRHRQRNACHALSRVTTRDTEPEQSPNIGKTRTASPDLFGSAAPAKKLTRGTRLPPDWRPSDADIAAAIDAGLARPQAEREADTFRDYWHAKAGADATKLDWSATWRNWCRRAADRLPRKDFRHDARTPTGRQGSGRPSAHDTLAAAVGAVFGLRDGDPAGDVVAPGDFGGGQILDFEAAGGAFTATRRSS